jgi:glutathione S-transferase
MTDLRQTSRVATRPNHVQVYGNDHSPWVQAVMLGLHEMGIPYTLVTVPPLSVFLRSGVLMPAARIDDGPWILDSGRILAELGFSKVGADERRALQAIFLSGAMRRTDDAWRFWHRFSYVRDGHPLIARRLWNQLWRPFSMLYFFTLIRIGRRARPAPTTDQLIRQFGFWQDRLAADSAFLGGRTPDTVDLQLFGLVQMCASIPGPSLALLREDAALQRLRKWIEAMQSRFADYPHLYSAAYFLPALPEVEPAPFLERFFYWCGAALMWIALPITLPLALYFVRRVRRKGLQRP